MGSPVRFTNGVTNALPTDALAMFGLPDPTKWHTYFTDFDTFVVGDWTITTTEAGAGAATEALGDIDGGVLVVTNDDADNDADFFQKVGESFLPAQRKRLFGKIRFSLSNATQSEFYFGLMVTDTDPLSSAAGDGVTDGIFFMSEDEVNTVSFYVQKDATTGQLSTTTTTTISDATYTELAFYYDGKKSVHLFKDNVRFKIVDLGSTPTTYLPDTELTVSFGLKNGSAGAKVLNVDYILVSQER